MEEVLEFIRQVGDMTGDTSLGRGLAACIGVIGVTLATAWQLMRRTKPDRVKVWVNAPAGKKVSVQLGEDSSEVK